MQKLMKNWIVTLIVCMLLTAFSVLMFLSGFKVGGMEIGHSILKIVAAAALAVYTVLAVMPLVVRYRGAPQGCVFAEIALLLLAAVALVIINFGVSIPLLSKMDIFAVVGLALWLRGITEIVRAYTSNAAEKPEERIPLRRLFLYILISSVGVWQMVNPLVEDDVFVFVIAGVSAIMAVIFGCATVVNRKAGAEERRAKKAEKAAKKAAANAAKAEVVAAAEAARMAQQESASTPAAVAEAAPEPAALPTPAPAEKAE